MDEKTLCPAAVRAFDGKESPQNFSMMSRLSKDAAKSIGGHFSRVQLGRKRVSWPRSVGIPRNRQTAITMNNWFNPFVYCKEVWSGLYGVGS